MKTYYNGNSKKSGVYKIINIINNRIYIGSCKSFKQRYKEHLNSLRNNKHSNKFLQADFNKCGEDLFEFYILEVVEGLKINRLEKEQYYLNQYFDNGNMCYNLRKDAADTREGIKNNKASDKETDKRCKSPSKEVKEKRENGFKNFLSENPDYKISQSQKMKNIWDERSKNKKIVLIELSSKKEVEIEGSLRNFCSINGLNYKSMNQMINGIYKTSSGYSLKL